jgi:hypothetical protein
MINTRDSLKRKSLRRESITARHQRLGFETTALGESEKVSELSFRAHVIFERGVPT